MSWIEELYYKEQVLKSWKTYFIYYIRYITPFINWPLYLYFGFSDGKKPTKDV